MRSITVLDEPAPRRSTRKAFASSSLSNGTHVKIGGFLVEGFIEDSVEGVHSLPVELSAKDEFSTTEAALVLQLAKTGNLFVGRPTTPDVVATTGRVVEQALLQAAQAGVDHRGCEAALTEWIRQNVPPQDAAEPGNYSSSSSSFFCCSSRFLISIHSSSRFRSIGLRAGGALGRSRPSLLAEVASVVVRVAARSRRCWSCRRD